MNRTLELTRVWAAVTGLALIAVAVLLLATGHALNNLLPLLVAAVVGYEMGITGYQTWQRRRHG